MPRESLLLALSEVSITLVGFAGIVFFLGRRGEGVWTPGDKARMWGMLEMGLLVFFLTLVPFVVWEVGFDERSLWGISSAIGAGAGLFSLFFWFRRGARARTAEDPEVSTFGGVLVTGILAGLLILLGLNAVGVGFERAFAPYLFTVVWLLMMACLLFLRLLRFW